MQTIIGFIIKGTFIQHFNKVCFFVICISLQQCMTGFAWSLIRTFLPLSRAFTQIHRRIQPGGGFTIWGIHSQVLLLTWTETSPFYIQSSHEILTIFGDDTFIMEAAKVSEEKPESSD